jgi:hypothetical protein
MALTPSCATMASSRAVTTCRSTGTATTCRERCAEVAGFWVLIPRSVLRGSSFRSSFEPMHKFFGKHTQKLADSLYALESGWVKNKLEEFRLSENPALYHRYQLLMNTLRFFLHGRALRQGVDTVEKHRLVSSIVVLGSTLAMANWLVCKTIFTIDE